MFAGEESPLGKESQISSIAIDPAGKDYICLGSIDGRANMSRLI